MKRCALFMVPLAAAPLLASCSGEADRQARMMTQGDPQQGRALIQHYGCGRCHTIPGIPDADALVGPPLNNIASRSYIAGVLTNTPEEMMRWIQDPPKVDPLTAMPNLRVTDEDVRSIVAYLYTLR